MLSRSLKLGAAVFPPVALYRQEEITMYEMTKFAQRIYFSLLHFSRIIEE